MQLALSLAQRFNGEIINGDALQMYEGLPITTNKLPSEERKGIPHHLLDCVTLEEEPWTVKHFVERASGIIQDIRLRGRLPILVGGTHYYTQSLLFGDTLVKDDATDNFVCEKQAHRWQLLDASAEDMLKELRKVDPEIAMQWHPSDRRKIRRSLEIWLKTGKKASEIYRQQKLQSHNVESNVGDEGDVPNGSNASARSHARCDPLIFWIHAPLDVLKSRLEDRVDTMIRRGLLEEVAAMQIFLQGRTQRKDIIDQSHGIWVAIGYKEFLPYVLDASRPKMLMQKCIERTKSATRQYAKRQDRWIRLRLQRALSAANLMHRMFLLDATDFSQWSERVDAKAQHITAAFIGGSALPQPDSLSDAAMKLLISPEEEAKVPRYCESCDKTLMFQREWITHLKSRGHRASVRPKIDWEKLYPKNSGH